MARDNIGFKILNPKVYLELGVTINLGNFQSAKATVGMGIDVPDDRTVDETMAWLRGQLLERLDSAIQGPIDFAEGR